MKNVLDKIFSNPTPLKRFIIGGVIGLVFGLLIVILYLSGVFDSLEYILADFRTTSFTNKSKISTKHVVDQVDFSDSDIPANYRLENNGEIIEGDIIYLSVDDASLEQLEIHDGLAYPWPRAVWGDVLDFLYASEVRSITFDISFFQGHPSTERGSNTVSQDWLSDKEFADTMSLFDDTVLATAFTRSVGSDQFTSSIKNAQLLFSEGWYKDAFIGITLAYYNTENEEEKSIAKKIYEKLAKKLDEKIEKDHLDITYRSFEEQLELVSDFRKKLSEKINKYRLYNFTSDNSVKIDSALSVEPPFDLLLGGKFSNGPANSIGDVKLMPDSDGVSRRTVSIVEYDGNYYPSLFVSGVMESLNFDNKYLNVRVDNKHLYLGDADISRKEFEESLNLLKTEFDNMESLLKDVSKDKECLMPALNNAIEIMNSLDISSESPFSNIEEYMNRDEREFTRLNILRELSKAYLEFDPTVEDTVITLDSVLNETISLFNSDFLRKINNRELSSINQALRSYGKNNYDKLIQSVMDSLNTLPFEIATNYSIILQRVTISLINIGGYDEFEQEETTEENYEFAPEKTKELFESFNTIAVNFEKILRKCNEIKNHKTMPIDDKGLFRIKFYGNYKTLPNISIYKVIKTWKSIELLWEARVVGGSSSSGDILQLAFQYIRNNALRYFADNIFDKVLPEQIENALNVNYYSESIKEYVASNGGLDSLVEPIVKALIEKNPRSDMHWIEYYSYYKNDENTRIYNEISDALLKGDFGYFEYTGADLIDNDNWRKTIDSAIKEILKKVYDRAENERFDLMFSYTEDDLTDFLKTFMDSLKSANKIATNLIEQKVLFNHSTEGIITLDYTDDQGIALSSTDMEALDEQALENTREIAFNDRVRLIQLGAEILEEYVILSLQREGKNINDSNMMESVLEVIDKRPVISSEDLLNALFKVYNDDDTPQETKNLIDSIQLVNPETFKNKVILVMTDASSLLDLRKTPFETRDAGGNLHGHAMMNTLNEDYAIDMDKPSITVLIILLISVIICALAVMLPVKYSILTFILIFASYSVVAILLHYFASMFINMSSVIIGLTVSFIAGITISFVLETRQKGFIEGAFSQFLAPEILNKLMADPSKLTLGGETKELTVFFSDIAGFTSLSEQLTPERLVEILNYYLTKMADIIVVDNNGYVDKYEGDAIMAFWGAPVEEKDHALKACYAAIDNQKKLKEIQEYFESQGLKAGISIRIGLNTGKVVVGMMGSQKKLNYTVIGDAVNLASRLEGANKQFSTEIMISEHTYAYVKDFVEARELDLMRVKGKKEPTRVYELIDRKGAIEDDKIKLIQLYNKGLEAYRKREFSQASQLFSQALDIQDDDGPSKTYLKRCEEYINNPPPKDWDGVFVMTTK